MTMTRAGLRHGGRPQADIRARLLSLPTVKERMWKWFFEPPWNPTEDRGRAPATGTGP